MFQSILEDWQINLMHNACVKRTGDQLRIRGIIKGFHKISQRLVNAFFRDGWRWHRIVW